MTHFSELQIIIFLHDIRLQNLLPKYYFYPFYLSKYYQQSPLQKALNDPGYCNGACHYDQLKRDYQYYIKEAIDKLNFALQQTKDPEKTKKINKIIASVNNL